MEDPGVETRAAVVLLVLMLVSVLVGFLVLETVVVLLSLGRLVLVQGDDATDRGRILRWG